MRETDDKLTIGSFSAGGLMRLGCLGSGLFWLLSGLFFGVLALFGQPTVRINGGPVYGVAGLGGGIALGSLFAGVASLGFLIGALVARRMPRLKDVEIWRDEAGESSDSPSD